MLSQQFFTRVQVTKLLGFKSVSMLQSLEEKGLIKPDIKPSKYSLNQVLFMFVCKELVDFSPLKWTHLIKSEFNQILSYNLYDIDMMYIINYVKINKITVQFFNDSKYKILNEYIDVNLFDSITNLKEWEDVTYEDIPSFTIINNKNNEIQTIIFSINRVYRKLQNKCTELKINLEEKVTA